MRPCSFAGCGRRHYSHGYCRPHAAQQRAGKPLTPIAERRRQKGTTCSLAGCTLPAKAKGLCRQHHRNRARAELRGELDLGEWRRPIRHWRRDTSLHRVRVPRRHRERIAAYAEARGLPLEDALVELALRALADVWPERRAA